MQPPNTEESNKQQAPSSNRRCPVCKSHHVTYLPVGMWGDLATQPAICKDCASTWENHYTLEGSYRVHDKSLIQKMTTHTPGPWALEASLPLSKNAWVLRAANYWGQVLAYLTDTSPPNAHLMAAAPIMFKALEDLVAEGEARDMDRFTPEITVEISVLALLQAREAIAQIKVKGKTP